MIPTWLAALLVLSTSTTPAGSDSATSRLRFGSVEGPARVLDNPKRDSWQLPAAVIDSLSIEPGQRIAAILWSVAAGVLVRQLPGIRTRSAGFWIGAAVFSHWILDFLVHRPDLPLYDDTMKVGLGFWNYPALALSLEAVLLFGGMFLYLRVTKPINSIGRLGPPVFGVIVLAIQGYIFLGPPPASPAAAAVTALVTYLVFACVVQWLARQRNYAVA